MCNLRVAATSEKRHRIILPMVAALRGLPVYQLFISTILNTSKIRFLGVYLLMNITAGNYLLYSPLSTSPYLFHLFSVFF